MDKGIIPQIKEAIEPLAGALQQGAEFTYEVFYRQTIVEGIIGLVISVVALTVLIIATVKILKHLAEKQKEYSKHNKGKDYFSRKDFSDYAFGWTLGLVMGWAFVGVFACSHLVDSAMKVGNPHYYTIKRVVETVKAKEVR